MRLYPALIIGLVLLVGGALAMHLLINYPGYVFIRLGYHEIYFNFYLGLVLIAIVMFFFYIAMKLLKRVFGSFTGSVSWWKHTRERRRERRTQQGLLHFMQGDWVSAKKELISAAKDAGQPLVHYLAAARSAYELGQMEESQFLLGQAEKVAPADSLAVNLQQARFSLASGQYEQGLASLRRIETSHAKHPVVIDLLRQVYIQLKDWPELKSLLPRVKQAGIMPEKAFKEFEIWVYQHLLSAPEHGDANRNIEEQQTHLEAAWQSIPKALKSEIALVGLYAQRLHQLQDDDAAELLLRKTLKNNWNSALVELYGDLKSHDLAAQLHCSEVWLKAQPDDPYLLFATGKLAIANALWGKARDYFEASLRIKERPEVYAALGQLLAQLGEHEKSTQLFQRGLSLKS